MKRSSTLAATGAPAEMTRRSEGIRLPWIAPWRPRRLMSAGEPNMLVTPKFSTASKIFTGSTSAGRVKSMSGMMAVMPSAGANSAKSGKVGRSISPGWMP